MYDGGEVNKIGHIVNSSNTIEENYLSRDDNFMWIITEIIKCFS